MSPSRALLIGAVATALVSCTDGDRLRLRFADSAAREEARRVDVYAVVEQSRGGEALDCAGLLERSTGIDDDETLAIVQTTSLQLPVQTGPSPLLVQVPQGRYLFLALAHDDFGFEVAKGCAADSIGAGRNLDGDLELATVPAPEGRLEAAGPLQWLQHAGPPGIEGAPSIAVRTLDRSGRPQIGVEVRLRVESGHIVPLETQLNSSDALDPALLGVARTSALASSGLAQVLVHARGLDDSPLRFEITGLPSPQHEIQSHILGGPPVTVLAENFHFDALATTDLLVVYSIGGEGQAALWRAGEGGGVWETTSAEELLSPAIAALGGLFDSDPRPDLVTVSDQGGLHLEVYHHHDSDGDRLRGGVIEALPSDLLALRGIAAVQANDDSVDDLLVLAESAAGLEALLFFTRNIIAQGNEQVFVLGQRFSIPDFAADATLAVGDLDGDGDDEMLLQSFISGVWFVPCGTDRNGSGHGRFYAPEPISTDDWPHLFSSLGSTFAAIADVTGDGLPDVVLASDASVVSGSVAWQLAVGTGRIEQLSLSPRQEVPLDGLDQALLADLNGDGHLDLLLRTNQPPQRAALLGGDGSGQFAAPQLLDVAMTVRGMAVADIDIDGVMDVAFAGSTVEAGYIQLHRSVELIH